MVNPWSEKETDKKEAGGGNESTYNKVFQVFPKSYLAPI